MAEVVNEILKVTKSDLEINHIKTGERYGNIYEDSWNFSDVSSGYQTIVDKLKYLI